MTPEEAQEHADIFGKVCFNCDNCCQDPGIEVFDTEYWCQDLKQMIMNKHGAINSWCSNWIVRDDSN